MVQKKVQKIHFMGIGGSGMAFAAGLAQKSGYEVTGCDLNIGSYYIGGLKKAEIELFESHDITHLTDVDILVVSPALLLLDKKHPELSKMKKSSVMIWQEFVGAYLQKNKKVICIAGTHGKSTTAALAASVFEDAGADPVAIVGSIVKSWKTGFRFGKGSNFIQESDEFNDNFLNYQPECIVLNNIEYDHPDFFKSELQLLDSFENHLNKLVKKKILIVNQDSIGVSNLMFRLGKKQLESMNMYGYTLSGSPKYGMKNSTCATVVKRNASSIIFSVHNSDLKLKDEFKLSMVGDYNVENALGVIILARLYGISVGSIQKSLSSFQGLGRRMDLIGKKHGVYVYDDYAHHPTAIKATLSALRQKHSDKKIIAVAEPHMFSRTKALLQHYNGVFRDADSVIIVPIYRSRDKEEFGVSGESVVEVSGHANIKYLDSFDKAITEVKKKTKGGGVVIVMGAGDSYLLARDLVENL